MLHALRVRIKFNNNRLFHQVDGVFYRKLETDIRFANWANVQASFYSEADYQEKVDFWPIQCQNSDQHKILRALNLEPITILPLFDYLTQSH